MILPLLLSQHHHPQGIHHPGDIDPLGAPRGALEAGSTEPERIHSKGLLFQTQKRISDDLMGANLHGKGNRASCRAVPTLVTGEEALAANQLHFLRKFVMNFLPRQFNLHC